MGGEQAGGTSLVLCSEQIDFLKAFNKPKAQLALSSSEP